MLFQNKDRVAYLSALTLLFSYAELLLPKIVPFFRLGLGNVAVLLSFNLSPFDFLMLTVIKAAASNLMAGTLFTPFMIISLVQSVASGLFMYVLVKISRGKIFSVFGISVLGSCCSAFIQIVLSSLYLGSGTKALLGPMIIFSVFSGLLCALISILVKVPEDTPVLNVLETQNANSLSIIKLVVILCASIIILMLKNIYVLTAALSGSFVAQILSRRKIKIIPHISLWLFVIISSLVIPNGKVLFSIWQWNITQGALVSGIQKALRLSAVSALSQCLANIKLNGNGIVALSLSYFRGLQKVMDSAEGNIFIRIKTALSSVELTE